MNGHLKFEGEYSSGKKWVGNEYKGDTTNRDISSKLKDGKGLMKEYNYYGKLLFEG